MSVELGSTGGDTWLGCRPIGRLRWSWPPGWRASSTSRASPRLISPTSWASAGSASPGCSTPPGRAGWCALRSGCPAEAWTRGCRPSCARPSGSGTPLRSFFPTTTSRRRAVSWSRTLSGLAAALTQMPPCPIVQLTGAVPPPEDRDLLDLVHSVARVGGGPAHVFYAPMILDDAQSAAAIRRQADIAEAFALVPSVTMALVSIGAWAPGLSTIYDAITPADRYAISRLGVCAELAGVFIGGDGKPIDTPLDGRMIVTPGPVL